MDHDNPCPGPLPHRTCAELVGGPLDGLLLDAHGRRTEKVDDGVARAHRTLPVARRPCPVRSAPRRTPRIRAPASAAASTAPATALTSTSAPRVTRRTAAPAPRRRAGGRRAGGPDAATAPSRRGRHQRRPPSPHRAAAGAHPVSAAFPTRSGTCGLPRDGRPGAAAGVLRGTASGAGDGPDDDLCRDPPRRTCHDRTGRRGSSSRLKRSPSTPQLPRLLLASGRRPSHRPDDREARTSTAPRSGAPGAAPVIVAVRSGRRTRGSADAGEHSSYPASTSAVVASRRHQALRCPPPARCPAARHTCG